MVHGLSPIAKACILTLLPLFLAAGCQKFNWEGAGTTAKTDSASGPASTPSNQVQTPFLSPPAGAYNASQSVSIASATPGANICYTVDGSTPACDSTANCSAGTLFSTPVNVAASQTINAIACKATMVNSTIASGNYIYDITAPVITAVSPASAATVTTTQVSYTLSENCGTGTITWTRTGGTPDGLSPHVKPLVGSELAIGAHTNITIVNNPAVVANAIYDITFDCSDAAGNAATSVTSTGVTIDNVAPVISGTAPTSGAFVVNTQISYTLSENCASGNVTWTRTGGTADGASPHVQPIAGAEILAGVHTNITLAANPVLVSGTTYTIDFNCTDAAGNSATTVSNTSVTFDNVAPVIAGVSPANNSFVNTSQVSYSLSETCATGSILWTWISGSPDVNHNQPLVGGELTAGAHSNVSITNNPTLVSGALYNLTFSCTDFAGNAATAVTVTNITFDSVGPVISAVAPASSAGVNTTQVSFTLSENCATASITWTWSAGAADVGSPHVQGLAGAELTAGVHNNITLTANPTLVSGALYTLDFNCTDASANAATTVTVTNVYFDNIVPSISAIAPASNAFVNNQQISYTLSEQCATGTANWTWVSGTPDGGHNQGLVAAELTAGPHNNFVITNNPVLVSGAVYNLTISCTDPGGNVAAPLTATNITFDNTVPTATIANLRNNGWVNTGLMIGAATDNTTLSVVEVDLDGGGFGPATGTTAWNFVLPTGATTWLDRSAHTITVRSRDLAGNISVPVVINVKKGNNQDVNRDGFVDTAVGAWQYTSGTGRAYIFHGSPSGIASMGAAAANRVLTGAATSNFFSRNMAFGDFNGDGYGDIAICAYGFSANTGQVTIYNGSAGGVSATPNVTIPGSASSQFGSVLIAGNANNDPYTDLVIASNAWSASQGRIQSFHGGAGGMATTPTITITGEAGASQFGSSIALGDFNGDNQPDLAVGATAYSTNLGRAYIFWGAAGALVAGTAGTATAIATGAAGDFYGASMASGDINGDGITDLAIGAYGFSTNTGRIYLYNGSGGGITLGNAATPTTTFTGEATNNYFTTSIAIADIHADGFADVIVGAYGYTTSTGRSYIFSGQATPLTSGSAVLATTIITGETTTTNYGRGSGAFDVNGDGLPDVMNGANFYGGNQGRAYIFHSPITGMLGAAGANTLFTGEAGTTEFGINISR